jgi:hypothetical protein
MAGFMKMPGRMLVFGIVAAAHFSAYQAQAQVNPDISDLEAFLASLRGRGYIIYQAKVRTLFVHIHLAGLSFPDNFRVFFIHGQFLQILSIIPKKTWLQICFY